MPEPTLQLSRTEARRFQLAHRRFWPPRRLEGKADIYAFIGRVGCIQYDPIDAVCRNPDLVLQLRLAGYRPALLEELLHTYRFLWEGRDEGSARSTPPTTGPSLLGTWRAWQANGVRRPTPGCGSCRR
jgi:uncharacterized protein YcaQ